MIMVTMVLKKTLTIMLRWIWGAPMNHPRALAAPSFCKRPIKKIKGTNTQLMINLLRVLLPRQPKINQKDPINVKSMTLPRREKNNSISTSCPT